MPTPLKAIEILDIDEGLCPRCLRFTDVMSVVVHDWQMPGELTELCQHCVEKSSSRN